AQRSKSGYRALRTDGIEQDLSSSELAQSLRDGQALRDMLGTQGASLAAAGTEISVMLASLGGPALGLAEFADGFVPAGYSRTFYGPSGELDFGQAGVLDLTGPGFERIEPIVPGPQHLASYERVNAKLGTTGRFFPSQAFDRALLSTVALLEEPVHQQFYYSVTTVPDGQGGERNVSVPYLMPLKPGMDRQRIDVVHALPKGFVFSMTTGRRDVSGDLVQLVGEPSAAAIYGSDMFWRAHSGEGDQQVLMSCWANAAAVPGEESPAFQLKKVKGSPPKSLIAADNLIEIDAEGKRSVQAGGHFREVGSRHTDPIPLSDLAAGQIAEAAAFRHWTNGDVRRLARQVARAAAWRERNKAGLPVVEIVGHGFTNDMGHVVAAALERRFLKAYQREKGRLAELGLPAPDVVVRLTNALYSNVPYHLWRTDGVVRVELPENELGMEALESGDHGKISAAFAALAPDHAPPAPNAPGSGPAPAVTMGPLSAQAVDVVSRLDLTRTVDTVAAERDEPSEERRFTWAGRDRTAAMPSLPALSSLPQLVHSVWLPGGLRTAEAVTRFRNNLEHAVRAAGDRWRVVLWTDVTREKLASALRPLTSVRHDVGDEDEDELTEIADTYDWARSFGIALVNIQEGIEAAESAQDTPLPADEDVVDEILSRFGGVYLPPEGDITELRGFTPIGQEAAAEAGLPGRSEAADSDSDLSERVLQAVLDGLRDHPGHLDLAAVAGLLEGNPDAGEVWTTVLAFLAADPELAAQVRTVTLQSVDEAGVPRRVVLPPLAAELLHLSEEPPFSPEPGEFTYNAELTRPAWLPISRKTDPTTNKEDQGHHD
ncbi:hypothetical protein, partial [Amycolatopsis japonica]